jgi:hypothetical protein
MTTQNCFSLSLPSLSLIDKMYFTTDIKATPTSVGSTVGKICFVFDYILHTAYTVDAYALTSILSSLSMIYMMYCTADTKATPASVQGVGVDF